MDYYVYVFLDPRKPGKFRYNNFSFDFEPYYVGKGNNKRIEKHFFKYHLKNDKNRSKSNKILKIIKDGFKPKEFILKIAENLLESAAMEIEIDLILKIGRKDKKLGPLTNLTDGGDGISGYEHVNKGKRWEDIIGTMKAKKLKNKLSKERMGRKNPMFGKKNRSGKPVKQFDLDNNLIKIWDCIRDASESLNIKYGAISKCLTPKGGCKQAGGFRWEYVDKPNPRNHEKDKRFHTYRVTFPNGDVKIIENLSELARREGLSSGFFPAISNRRTSSKRWKCEKVS